MERDPFCGKDGDEWKKNICKSIKHFCRCDVTDGGGGGGGSGGIGIYSKGRHHYHWYFINRETLLLYDKNCFSNVNEDKNCVGLHESRKKKTIRSTKEERGKTRKKNQTNEIYFSHFNSTTVSRWWWWCWCFFYASAYNLVLMIFFLFFYRFFICLLTK